MEVDGSDDFPFQSGCFLGSRRSFSRAFFFLPRKYWTPRFFFCRHEKPPKKITVPKKTSRFQMTFVLTVEHEG